MAERLFQKVPGYEPALALTGVASVEFERHFLNELAKTKGRSSDESLGINPLVVVLERCVYDSICNLLRRENKLNEFTKVFVIAHLMSGGTEFVDRQFHTTLSNILNNNLVVDQIIALINCHRFNTSPTTLLTLMIEMPQLYGKVVAGSMPNTTAQPAIASQQPIVPVFHPAESDFPRPYAGASSLYDK